MRAQAAKWETAGVERLWLEELDKEKENGWLMGGVVCNEEEGNWRTQGVRITREVGLEWCGRSVFSCVMIYGREEMFGQILGF